MSRLPPLTRRAIAAVAAAAILALAALIMGAVSSAAAGPRGAEPQPSAVRAASIVEFGVCDVPLIHTGCAALGAVASGVAGDVTKAVTGWIADGAAALLGGVLDLADASFTPDPGAGPVGGTLRRMSALAATTGVFWLLLVVVQAAMRGSVAVLWSGVQRLAVAGLATGGIVWGTRVLLGVADEMTGIVVGGPLSDHANSFVVGLGNSFHTAIDNGSMSLFLLAASAVLTVLIGLVLFIELGIRAAAVDLAVVFLPLMLAASVWSPAAGALRKLLSVLIAAIFSKFVIFVTLALALDLFAGSTGPAAAAGGPASGLLVGAQAAAHPGQTIGYFVVGVVLLLLAVMAPVALLSFISHAPEAVAAMAGTGVGKGGPMVKSAAMSAGGAATRGMSASASTGRGAGGRANGGVPVLMGGRTAATGGGGSAGPSQRRGGQAAGSRRQRPGSGSGQGQPGGLATPAPTGSEGASSNAARQSGVATAPVSGVQGPPPAAPARNGSDRSTHGDGR